MDEKTRRRVEKEQNDGDIIKVDIINGRISDQDEKHHNGQLKRNKHEIKRYRRDGISGVS